MTQRSGWRPEQAMILAVLLIGGGILVAGILMIAGVWRGGRPEGLVPYGIALVALGGIGAYLVFLYSRRLRRRQRPEWLETKAWQQGLHEKLQQGQGPPPGAGAPEQPKRDQPSG